MSERVRRFVRVGNDWMDGRPNTRLGIVMLLGVAVSQATLPPPWGPLCLTVGVLGGLYRCAGFMARYR